MCVLCELGVEVTGLQVGLVIRGLGFVMLMLLDVGAQHFFLAVAFWDESGVYSELFSHLLLLLLPLLHFFEPLCDADSLGC